MGFRRQILVSSLLGVSMLPAKIAHAQTPSAFEVASMRLSDPKSGPQMDVPPICWAGTNRLVATHADLELLITFAYGVSRFQIKGLPGWADSTAYDINAKAEGEKALTYDVLKPMLQQLLVERLQLKVHHEIKQVKGYALVLSKGGLKLTSAKGPTGGLYILPDGVQGQAMTLDMLAHLLNGPAGRPVVDRTGVEGKFDVNLSYAPLNDAESTLPSLFTALEEQIGLKLEPTMVPLDVLVVDHVEKVPPEN